MSVIITRRAKTFTRPSEDEEQSRAAAPGSSCPSGLPPFTAWFPSPRRRGDVTLGSMFLTCWRSRSAAFTAPALPAERLLQGWEGEEGRFKTACLKAEIGDAWGPVCCVHLVLPDTHCLSREPSFPSSASAFTVMFLPLQVQRIKLSSPRTQAFLLSLSSAVQSY